MPGVPTSYSEADEIIVDALAEGSSEAALVFMTDAARQEWRISQQRSGQWRIWCPCPENGKTHQTWITQNPDSESYFDQTRQRLGRMTCWEESG